METPKKQVRRKASNWFVKNERVLYQVPTCSELAIKAFAAGYTKGRNETEINIYKHAQDIISKRWKEDGYLTFHGIIATELINKLFCRHIKRKTQ